MPLTYLSLLPSLTKIPNSSYEEPLLSYHFHSPTQTGRFYTPSNCRLAMSKLTIETQEDSWRLRCPNGHKVAPTNDNWPGQHCVNRWDEEATLGTEEAVNEKIGDRKTRKEVELIRKALNEYNFSEANRIAPITILWC